MTEAALSSGPYVAAGFFCENVIEGKDGVLSVVRIVDRFTRTVTGPGAPDFMPPTPVRAQLLVSLKSGDAQGRHEVSVTVEQPSGLTETIVPGASVLLEGGERGANLVFDLDWLAAVYDSVLEANHLWLYPNIGSRENPQYDIPQVIMAGGVEIGTYMVSGLEFVDFDGDGIDELVAHAEFPDGWTGREILSIMRREEAEGPWSLLYLRVLDPYASHVRLTFSTATLTDGPSSSSPPVSACRCIPTTARISIRC